MERCFGRGTRTNFAGMRIPATVRITIQRKNNFSMPLEIHGRVVRGKGEGRALGYPTANLEYQSAHIPERGVWVCRAQIESREQKGLAVIGMWKLESGLPSVEIYLFDFHEDVYGLELSVSLEEKLRDLKFFSHLSPLVAQIEQDIREARTYFSP